jgi:hypothetical protein
VLFISAMFEADVLNGFCMGFCSGIKSGSIDALPIGLVYLLKSCPKNTQMYASINQLYPPVPDVYVLHVDGCPLR